MLVARWTSLLVLVAPVSTSACERSRAPEAKPLHEKDGLGRPDPSAQTPPSTCGGAPNGGKIIEAVTLRRGCVLHVARTLVVEGGAAIAIEPGVRLLFARGAALQVVDGTIEAKGEKGAEIVFDSDASTPAAKDWNGIELVKSGAGTSLFDNVVIQHAGGGTNPASLRVHSSSHVSLGSCTVRDDGGAGIELEP